MSDDDEFDAASIAAVATGADVDEDPGADVDDPTPDPSDDDDGDDEDVVDAGAIALTYLAPLLTAPERGPTAPMLQQRGMDGRTAALLDGLIDYLLEVVGIDLPRNQLGPAGKMAVGLSQARAQAADVVDGDRDDQGGAGAGGEMSDEARQIMEEMDGAS